MGVTTAHLTSAVAGQAAAFQTLDNRTVLNGGFTWRDKHTSSARWPPKLAYRSSARMCGSIAAAASARVPQKVSLSLHPSARWGDQSHAAHAIPLSIWKQAKAR